MTDPRWVAEVESSVGGVPVWQPVTRPLPHERAVDFLQLMADGEVTASWSDARARLLDGQVLVGFTRSFRVVPS